MTTTEFRKANLLKLIKEAGTAKAVADAVSNSPDQAQISRFVKGKRGIGHRTARKLESAFKKPVGWMDLPHPGPELTRDVAALLDAVQKAPK